MNNNVLAPTVFELTGDQGKKLMDDELDEQLRSFLIMCQLELGLTPLLNSNRRFPSIRRIEAILSSLNIQRIDISTRQIAELSEEAFDTKLKPFITAMVKVLTLRARSNTRRSTANPVKVSLKLGGLMYAGQATNDLQIPFFQKVRDMFGPLPIRELDLSHTAGGSRVLGILMAWIKDQLIPGNLELLNLLNYGLSLEDSVALCDVLRSHGSSLKGLNVSRNRFGDEGAVEFGSLLGLRGHQLESFTYTGNSALRPGSNALCSGLLEASRRCDVLQFCELVLDDLLIETGENEDDNVHKLDRVLSKCPNLHTLGLSGCELQSSGLERIIAAVQASGASLTTLYLADNELEDAGIIQLVDSEAVYADTLRFLDLDKNEISQIGTQRLIDNRLPALQTLSLEDNLDIPLSLAEDLQALYGEGVVRIDLEDLEEPEEDISTQEALAGLVGSMNQMGFSQEY